MANFSSVIRRMMSSQTDNIKVKADKGLKLPLEITLSVTKNSIDETVIQSLQQKLPLDNSEYSDRNLLEALLQIRDVLSKVSCPVYERCPDETSSANEYIEAKAFWAKQLTLFKIEERMDIILAKERHQLTSQQNEIVVHGVWIMTVVYRENDYLKRYLSKNDIVAHMLKLTSRTDDCDVARRCVELITSILSDDVCCHLVHINTEFIETLLAKLATARGDFEAGCMTRSCTRCQVAVKIQAQILHFFSALFIRDLPVSRPLLVKVILCCCHALSSESRDVVSAALEALFRSSDKHECVFTKTVIDHGLVPALVTHICSDDDCMRKSALYMVGDLLLGNETTSTQILRSSLLNHISFLILTNERSTNQVAWIVSNFAADGARQVDAVFDYHLLPIIIGLLSAPRDWIVLDSLWVIHNLFHCGSREQIQTVLANDAYGIIADVMSMLSVWLTRAEAKSSETAEDIVVQLFAIAELLCGWLLDIDSTSTKSSLAIIRVEMSREFYDSFSEQPKFYRPICYIKSRCREETWEEPASDE